MSAKNKRIVSALLAWFDVNARDLPWRRTSDAYAIWVSEIMLQQTQVKTVIPYWERWLQNLPTIRALAEARPETIHKLWEGLGYYTRVRNLQKAAQVIMIEHGGRFPNDYESILALPGIGRYTAGAIASIAFNQPKPILDGNVIRVLTRLFGIAENPREKSTNAQLWQLAQELVTAAYNINISSTHHAPRTTAATCSHLNQSLMELGALICTPRQPNCPLCPVRPNCVAYRTGKIEQLPNLGPRTVATSRHFFAFVIEKKGRYFVRQRPAGVVNAHLWEFPNIELAGSGTDSDLKLAAQSLFGMTPDSLKPLTAIKHSITRYRITLKAFHGVPPKNGARWKMTGHWRTPAELHKLAYPSAHRKILARLGK